MKRLLIALSILVFLSCLKQKPVNNLNQKDYSNQLDTLISGKSLIIKDTTQYAHSFIQELLELSKFQESVKLMDDNLIVITLANARCDSLDMKPFTDCDIIPTNLELNKEIVYSTKAPEKIFVLILKRTNFTNIDYQLKNDGKTIKSGTAILNASFFLGAEAQDDEVGKTMYLNQYTDKKGFESYLKIEINKAERATFTYCTDKKTGKYENLPIFIREYH
jgi:hypothetical protein